VVTESQPWLPSEHGCIVGAAVVGVAVVVKAAVVVRAAVVGCSVVVGSRVGATVGI